MGIINRTATAAAGLSLVVAPVAATAAPTAAAKLSIAGNRAATPTARGSKLGSGVGGATLINIGILAALVVIVLVATSGDDDSDSN